MRIANLKRKKTNNKNIYYLTSKLNIFTDPNEIVYCPENYLRHSLRAHAAIGTPEAV